MSEYTAELQDDPLYPVLGRVRTDITAIKTDNGSCWTSQPLTRERMAKHRNGGPARGVCPIKAGESTTMLALLDLDNHKGELDWDAMAEFVGLVCDALRDRGGAPIPFRSSGGHGAHVYLLWDEPQDAYSVRQWLKTTLEAIGLQDGTKGVAAGQVEIFPKQDAVPEDGFGNQFILPLAGASEPLEPLIGYYPAGRDHVEKMDWPTSAPVPVLEKPERPAPSEPALHEQGKIGRALDAIPNSGTDELDYDGWWKVVAAIHATWGEVDGLPIAHAFSARSSKYDPAFLDNRVWPYLKDRENSVGPGTILHLASRYSWSDVAEPDEFEVVENEPEPAPVLDPNDPKTAAGEYVRRHATEGQYRTLHYRTGRWYEFDGVAYRESNGEPVRARIWDYLHSARKKRQTKKGTVVEPYQPKSTHVSNLIDALQGESLLNEIHSPPCWLDGRTSPSPADLVALQNGLLDISSLTLHPHTPAYFTVTPLPFGWEPQGPEPTAWLEFLGQLWPDDMESVEALQEWMGYCLTADTSLQKILLLVGPKRSGKGTIGRVMTALLGQHNVAGPTLGSLSTNFGLQPLIGKLLALISDARLGSRANQDAIAERLLAISGEDAITVDRKHETSWTGRLSARFMLLSNELPRINDASGALSSRFVVLRLDQSFYGREDRNLTDRLLAELPGIFRWAIEGRRRLNARGHFLQPTSATQDIEELEGLTSPVHAFIQERCELPGNAGGSNHDNRPYQVSTSLLFNEWCDWCRANGRKHPGTSQSFGRDLRAVVPGLSVKQERVGGERVRAYTGLRLSRDVTHTCAGMFDE